jgi:hypothetical protein
MLTAPIGRKSFEGTVTKCRSKAKCKNIDLHAFHGSSPLKPLVFHFTAAPFHGSTHLMEHYGIILSNPAAGLP